MTPKNADKIQNHNVVHAIHTKRYNKLERKRKNSNDLPFAVGDTVQVKLDPKKISTERRAYAVQFKGEYFNIVSINNRMPIALYYIKSMDNDERIEGGFYAEELQKVQGSVFKIEKIIDRKKVGRVKQIKVRWLHFGPRHDSWINEKDIIEEGR
jgi:hypothetical protein